MSRWFSLIGVSTLTLYQHHVIDIVGGFILATVCFYTIRPEPFKLPVTPNPGIGRLYTIPLIVCVILVAWKWPWGVIFLWPTATLALLIVGYVRNGPGLFRKTDGLIPVSAKIVLAPILFAQWLSLKYYARQCDAWNQVAKRVWIGRVLTETEARAAVSKDVTHVLDLTAEFDECRTFRDCQYTNIQVLDLTAPTQDQLQRAVDFIGQAQANGIVYIHCKIGYSRSAAVVCAWLLESGQANTVQQAIDLLREVRSTVVIRPEIHDALICFQSKVA